MITVTKTGVARARRALSPAAASTLRAAQQVAVWREGDVARQMLIDHLTGRKLHGKRPARLKATTLATRRAHGNNSAAPLADTREMIRAIALKRMRRGVFIGIPSSSVNRKGFSLAKIADLQENGATIVQRITPKMVAKLRQMGVPPAVGGGSGISSGVVVIKIKPRPFMEPLLNAYKRDRAADDRMAAIIRNAMAGWWR